MRKKRQLFLMKKHEKEFKVKYIIELKIKCKNSKKALDNQ